MSENKPSRYGLRLDAIALLAVWLIVTLVHIHLYRAIHSAILEEMRGHAMGVAIAAAAGIDPEWLAPIQGPEDIAREEFSAVQQLLDRISRYNPDVRYAYTMRRSLEPAAPESLLVYIVDQSAVDWNLNGIIDPSEESEAPGNLYDASELPEMIRAWTTPSADRDITPDPPYGDLLSGYAPIRDEHGITHAIVGIDITADTIREKVNAVAVGLVAGWAGLMGLTWVIYVLYRRQRIAIQRIERLNLDLEERNDLLKAANEKIVAHYKQVEEEMKLAQSVQLGMLPRRFPREDRVLFERYYLTCTILGGDLYDAFEIDERRIALFVADVSGHGVSAALISGLVKMALSTVRDISRDARATHRIDLGNPPDVVAKLNELLVNEVPDEDFITMIYAVIDVDSNRLSAASAGHPWPILRSREGALNIGGQTHQNGPALSLVPGARYPLLQQTLRPGDVLLFYTDGLTEAMNSAGEEFGEDRLLDVIGNVEPISAAAIIHDVRAAVDDHRSGCEVSDDFTLLAAEIRPREST
ncbi:MAG TPA: PP2C family protein-serine/threonine phosphatase [Kiritimatiellia bacterium]|nr:PP2C family protein-serine/threonine phosphatase [Kiritimatiellia bacterium]